MTIYLSSVLSRNNRYIRVAHDTVNPRHACRDQSFDKNSRHSFLHILFLASATFIGGRSFDYMGLRKTVVGLPQIRILDCSDQVQLLSLCEDVIAELRVS